MIKYKMPEHWIRYDPTKVSIALASAKASVLALSSLPYQRTWADKLQILQLKREVAGTSRIEGAEFSEVELDAAIDSPIEDLETRSQKQAAASVSAYRFISTLDPDMPVTEDLICQVHRLIVTGADDDHCEPGVLRGPSINVTFGNPGHRGAGGGEECKEAFGQLCKAVQGEYRGHDFLVCGAALHYHFAAMHPFLDGNGRTARALETVMLQKAGLRDLLFIALSNYYYEEKTEYLRKLAEVRAGNHDLTPFILFSLRGIEIQCKRLLTEIKTNVSKALFRNQMYEFLGRLKTARKRVIAERQIEILNILLENDTEYTELYRAARGFYSGLKNPVKAFVRDMRSLFGLGAIESESVGEEDLMIMARLEWPMEITETELFDRLKNLPKSKTLGFLSKRKGSKEE